MFGYRSWLVYASSVSATWTHALFGFYFTGNIPNDNPAIPTFPRGATMLHPTADTSSGRRAGHAHSLDSTTALFKPRADMRNEPFPECHGGTGELDWTEVLAGQEIVGRTLNFIHDNTLPPGVTIGVHPHQDDEEYYLILSGRGRMTLNEQQFDVAPGDIAGVFPGGRHGLENTGSEDMHLIVISMAPAES